MHPFHKVYFSFKIISNVSLESPLCVYRVNYKIRKFLQPLFDDYTEMIKYFNCGWKTVMVLEINFIDWEVSIILNNMVWKTKVIIYPLHKYNFSGLIDYMNKLYLNLENIFKFNEARYDYYFNQIETSHSLSLIDDKTYRISQKEYQIAFMKN